jgi:hypothetical protein
MHYEEREPGRSTMWKGGREGKLSGDGGVGE